MSVYTEIMSRRSPAFWKAVQEEHKLTNKQLAKLKGYIIDNGWSYTEALRTTLKDYDQRYEDRKKKTRRINHEQQIFVQ